MCGYHSWIKQSPVVHYSRSRKRVTARQTIVKFPSQNFNQIVRFNLLLRDYLLGTFFVIGVRFVPRESADISFLDTYVNGRFVQ